MRNARGKGISTKKPDAALSSPSLIFGAELFMQAMEYIGQTRAILGLRRIAIYGGNFQACVPTAPTVSVSPFMLLAAAESPNSCMGLRSVNRCLHEICNVGHRLMSFRYLHEFLSKICTAHLKK